MSTGWQNYDPSWLVEAAEELAPQHPWLPGALAECTRCLQESAFMLHFVDPARPNEPGSDWQFEENLILEHPLEGDLVLDVLKGNRIGGVEFLSKVLRSGGR